MKGQQIFAAMPVVQKGTKDATNNETLLLEEPLLSKTGDDDEECQRLVDVVVNVMTEKWPRKWCGRIVTIMIFVNTIATYTILEDHIHGLLISGNIHTLIEMISLFYIVNCPAAMLLYFVFGHHSKSNTESSSNNIDPPLYSSDEEMEEEDLESPLYGKVFVASVALITVLQNFICCQVFYNIYLN